MTHEEETDQFVGCADDDADESELCRRCNDYPCQCHHMTDIAEDCE